MVRERWYQGLRIGFGLLASVAIVVQLRIGVTERNASVANFFSFFTIQSNVLAAAVLLTGAILALRSEETRRGWEFFRGATTAYIVTTFIVFAALLSGLSDNLDLTEPWVNVVLHQLTPVVVVLDWIISPPRHHLMIRRTLTWMLYPLAYCVYSLVRGPIVDWYPYPFLNPDEVGGYGGVVAYAIGIAVLFAGIVWCVVTLGNRARDWWSARTTSVQPAV